MKNRTVQMFSVGRLLLAAAMCSSGNAALAAEAPAAFQLTVEQPEHGRLTVTPDAGSLPAGTQVSVHAEADSGFALDAVFQAFSGRFGRMYNESQVADFSFTLDRDSAVGALFLPQQELAGVVTTHDIVYAQPGVKPLKYDVFAPPGASNLPVVVIIHGGGWTANSEDIMRGMARDIARSGRYIAVSMDYRWAGKADGDAQGNSMDQLIGDVFGGLAHIQEHAAQYGGDPQTLLVTGDSAGGHLSAAAATMTGMIGDAGFDNGSFEFLPSYLPAGKSAADVSQSLGMAIKAAAPSYGVFAPAAEGRVGLSHFSESAGADESWAAAIAPINHIPVASARSIPHYLIRGTQDPLISKAMVDEYAAALAAQGQQVKQVEVEGASHAFYDWKPDAATRDVFAQYGKPWIQDMLAFFDEVVAKR